MATTEFSKPVDDEIASLNSKIKNEETVDGYLPSALSTWCKITDLPTGYSISNCYTSRYRIIYNSSITMTLRPDINIRLTDGEVQANITSDVLKGLQIYIVLTKI